MDEYEKAMTEEIKNEMLMIEAVEKDWRCHRVDYGAFLVVKYRLGAKIRNYQHALKIYKNLKSKGAIQNG